MVRLNIDFLGPINTNDDSGYILVIIDTFSKWVELYPCESATVKAGTECLIQNFSRYEAPSQILSDNGSFFVNELITEFLHTNGGILKKENAMIERANEEVNRHVRHVYFDRHIKSNWRQHWKRTGVSPVDIIFGKALDLDRDIFSALPEDQMYTQGSLSTHMAKLLKTQSDMIECIDKSSRRVTGHTLVKQ